MAPSLASSTSADQAERCHYCIGTTDVLDLTFHVFARLHGHWTLP
jgi:hypothetical protein